MGTILADIKLHRFNSVYMKVECDAGIAMELQEYFTFQVQGFQYMQAYKFGRWDGKLRIFSPFKKLIYAGLYKKIIKFAKARNYSIALDDFYAPNDFSREECDKFIASLNIPKQIESREYQIEAFMHNVKTSRGLLISPTASGKSYLMYLLTRFYNKKTLIVVPTIALVHQIVGDFKDYGYKENVHKIYSGQDKDTKDLVYASTWQSIAKMPKEWFKQFDVILGDEAHTFAAKSLTAIMEALDTCDFRFGLTGTLDGTQTNEMVLEGLFGPKKVLTTTSQLIEQGYVSDLEITMHVLKYPQGTCKAMQGKSYQEEVDYIIANELRNQYIVDLVKSLKGNTLVLFRFVEKHGDVLQEMLSNHPQLYYIHGGIDGEYRNSIREEITPDTNAVVLASIGTTSTGINIPALHNLIFVNPLKGRIKNLQSIGRTIRLSNGKTAAKIHDIADDFSYKKYRNYTLNHAIARLKTYNEENFKYTIINKELE